MLSASDAHENEMRPHGKLPASDAASRAAVYWTLRRYGATQYQRVSQLLLDCMGGWPGFRV
jgi:hypothetical protein